MLDGSTMFYMRIYMSPHFHTSRSY